MTAWRNFARVGVCAERCCDVFREKSLPPAHLGRGGWGGLELYVGPRRCTASRRAGSRNAVIQDHDACESGGAAAPLFPVLCSPSSELTGAADFLYQIPPSGYFLLPCAIGNGPACHGSYLSFVINNSGRVEVPAVESDTFLDADIERGSDICHIRCPAVTGTRSGRRFPRF